MNDNRDVNTQTDYVDPRTVEAQVIGELRKDKIGKPILVVEMFVLFAIVLIALPIVTNMMNNENSFLYKLFNPSTSVTPTPSSPEERPEFLDGSNLQSLAPTTTMKFENVVMKNFALKGTNINCDMYSYNGVLNLDEENLFLEVYSSSTNNLVAAVKLTGTYDNQVQSVSLTAANLSFNANYSYVGKIVEMEDKDYPDVVVNSDESGIGSFICTMDNRTIEYVFKNSYLINIKDSVRVKLADQKDNTSYLNLKKTYEDKVLKLGTISEVEEVADGFVFNANINLETTKIPTNINDYNYYDLDTEAKIIHYTMRGKGFDCK